MRHLRFTDDKESIGVLFDRAAEKMPDAVVRLDTPSTLVPRHGTTLTYAAMADFVREASGWFSAAGVRPGDRVAVAKTNHFDTLLLGAAAVRLGALPALLSGGIFPDQAPVMLDRLRPSAVFADRGVIDRWRLLDGSPEYRVVSLDGAHPGAVPLDDLRGELPPRPNPPAQGEPMILTHTSGTTGVPKMVQHSAASISHRAKLQTMPWPVVSFRRRDRYAAQLSWSHARAIDGMAAVLHIGCPLLAMATTDPEVASRALLEFRPTIMEALPNALLYWEPMIQANPEVFTDTRFFISAFDAIHPRTARICLDASDKKLAFVLQAYGQSESGGITGDLYTRRTVRRKPGKAPNLRSMGFKFLGMSDIRTVDIETGEPLPRGSFGEFEVKSKGLAMTYYGQEDLHARRRRNGWWTMGDVGVVTKTGRAILYDREIDLVPGVESCLELEDRLLDELPQLTEVVIVAVDGKAQPVVATAGEPLDRAAWAKATADLPQLEAPIQLPWEDIPRTATMKVRRRALVAQLEAQRAAAPADADPAPAELTSA
ncbi:MAG TPA: class I adenylate-forming enzyme family protein [Acidimicrobiales bacterium]|jgi:acyl-coenzyme A synthetase/AMP-(fatty) acid ligase